ncbi:MAG: hypothetical protein J6Y20_12650 [Lachnospiraceae bacterium]|nr:hypothetical protein [Lachnospiraceae bacterium]
MDYEAQEPIEVVPGLILGGIYRLEEILYMKPDVLFPLDSLPGWIWRAGFRGEVVYYPITDYNILPDDVLDRLVEAVMERMKAGRRVAICCVGGHGRTGYVASCVMHMLGEKRPIAFLRDKYSFEAVETTEQQHAIERFQKRHPIDE